MNVLGVDGHAKGWVGVRLIDGAFGGALVDRRLAALVDRAASSTVVAVDMPLGLVERGWREADLQAKAALVGSRRSSVFKVAPRLVWNEPDYESAKARCLELTGQKITQQAWALREKLLEARELWLKDPTALHEVHPELSFQALAGGVPLHHGKKTWHGQWQRRTLLAQVGIVLPDELGEADDVPPDDVLDAAAVAWTALRIATGSAARLPLSGAVDASGRPVMIRY